MNLTLILGIGIAALMFAFVVVAFVAWVWTGITRAITSVNDTLSGGHEQSERSKTPPRSRPREGKNPTRLHPQKQTEFATHPPLEFAAWRECPYCNVYDAHGILREPIRKSVRRMARADSPGGGRTFWYEKMRDHDAASIIRKCNKCSHIWGEK